MSALRIITSFASILVFCLSAGMNVQGQQKESGNTPALLYELSGNGLEKPSYLFGTVHLICPDDMIPIEKLNPYLDSSDQLILELDFDDPVELKALMALMTPSKEENLAVHLTRKQFDKIDEMTRSYLATPFADLQNLSPIILQSMLLTSSKGIGCNPPGSYEVTFIGVASMKKIPISGLESVADQMAALNKTPLEKRAESIYEIAKDPAKYFGQFKKLIKTYRTQDSDALYAFVQEQMKKDPGFQVNLLDERNKNWIPKIESAIAEKPAFIAVGAAHLGGENGILKLLAARGYVIKGIRL